MNPAWALLRLASPQLPIGGYSYSQGLEMAVDNGRVNDPDSARRWISDQLLLNLARFEAPLLLAHCMAAAEENWPELLQRCEEHRASRETRELHQESRQMGYSLQQLLNGLPELDAPARAFLEQCPRAAPGPGLGAGRSRLAHQPAGCAGRVAVELAGKPIGGADENPAAGPASRATPDQRTVAAASTSPAERHPNQPRTLRQRRFRPVPGVHGP